MTHPAEGDQYPHPDSPAGRAWTDSKTGPVQVHVTAGQPAKSQTILAEADSIVNGQRRADYGGPFESFSDIARGWSMVLGIEVTPEQVGLCMIQLKVARAKNGGFHRDSFVDIAGYAQCMEFIAQAREAQETNAQWPGVELPANVAPNPALDGWQMTPAGGVKFFRHADGRDCLPVGIDEIEAWTVVGSDGGRCHRDHTPWAIAALRPEAPGTKYAHSDGRCCELLTRDDGKGRESAWVVEKAEHFKRGGDGAVCDRIHIVNSEGDKA